MHRLDDIFSSYIDINNAIANNANIYLITNSAFSNLPFDMLYENTTINFHYINSIEDLNNRNINPKLPIDNSITIISHPNFNYDFIYNFKELSNIDNSTSSLPNDFYSPYIDDIKLDTTNYAELSQTEHNFSLEFSKYFNKCDKLTVNDCIESTIKNLSFNSILHICTHGEVLNTSASYNGHSNFTYNPLYDSFIVLTGINTFLSINKLNKYTEDCIFNADDILHCDKLSNTKLAVIATCSSGRGKPISGENCIGLSSSLFKAGCKAIIVSLWNVNVDATIKLMDYFYEHLSKKNSIYSSLNYAKNKLKKDEQYSNPYYWNAFICIGDDTQILF